MLEIGAFRGSGETAESELTWSGSTTRCVSGVEVLATKPLRTAMP